MPVSSEGGIPTRASGITRKSSEREKNLASRTARDSLTSKNLSRLAFIRSKAERSGRGDLGVLPRDLQVTGP